MMCTIFPVNDVGRSIPSMSSSTFWSQYIAIVSHTAFVSVTPRQLEVTVVPAHHQQLLKLLRGLHQRVKLSWCLRRHREFGCTFNA